MSTHKQGATLNTDDGLLAKLSLQVKRTLC
jgi:hypothetical protein